MDLKLELVVVPVADVDASKAFYEKAGFTLDIDHRGEGGFRMVQFTPPGSACSIAIGTGFPQAAPGSLGGLHLVVRDVAAARAALLGRGVEVAEPFHYTEEGMAPGVHPEHPDYVSFATFADLDGNGWLLQEVGYTPDGS